MGNGDQESPNKTVREWIKALGTLAAAIGIFTGVGTLLFKKEKEASDRLLHIIALLDTKNCQTVRAGASTTMGVYLDDYKQYQDRAYWVMANNLATEDDPLVRYNILNILKGAEANAIEPLACMNRYLLKEETRWQSSFLFNVDLVFQIDLDSGCISEELRKEFDKDKKNSLSENITVSIAEKDSKWLITDRGNKKIYSIRKDEYSLGIYENDNVTADKSLSRTQVDLSNPDDYFSLPEYNIKLFDTIEALVAVLEKKGFPKDEKLQLEKIILYNIESSSKINLDKANLKQASLMEAHLKDVSLKEAILTQADLHYAVLNNVDLTDANMTGANLETALLVGTILEGAHLSGAFLFSVDSKKFQSDLDKGTIPKGLQQEFEKKGIQLAVNARVEIKKKGAEYLIIGVIEDFSKKYRISKEQEKLNIYTDAILENAILESAKLRGAYLTNANLVGANLTDANMVKATLQGADLFEAVLTNANLAGADLFEAVLKYANLAGADLFEAVLTDANLEGANLTYSNMVNATLQGTNLFEADLTDANLAGADLKGANLESANLAGANLEGADLKAALLFGIDPNKFQSDLDKGTISEDLQQEFEYNQISLSKNTTISIEQKDRRWLINDKDNDQIYTVRKEEDRLNICKETKFDFTDIKKAINWQNAVFDDDVWQKLLSQQN